MDVLLKERGKIMFRRKLFILILVTGLFLPFSSVEVRAMDPVTIAILAPIAIQAAEVMMPYVVQGLKNAGVHLMKMGLDLAEVLKLPLGIVQATLGAPLGLFSDGLKNVIDGVLAPFQFTWHTLVFPLAIFGYST